MIGSDLMIKNFQNKPVCFQTSKIVTEIMFLNLTFQLKAIFNDILL